MAGPCSIPTTDDRSAPQASWCGSRLRSAALASRLSGDDTRPLLAGGDRAATLERLGSLREPAYEAAAHVQVDTEGRTVDEVAATVIEEYGAWNG